MGIFNIAYLVGYNKSRNRAVSEERNITFFLIF
uniref:Uncharacterized protein n=1 Tax=Arundo donax TaxID=35708 RepID=A0A0A9B1R7_ARUDO